MNNIPLFIRLHRNKHELIVNIRNINSVVPFADELTYIYLNNSVDPLCVDESYDEIKKKLLNNVWVI